MTEDIGLRLKLVEELLSLPYGELKVISHKDGVKAWPPTGVHNMTELGMWTSIALALDDHRPETSYTTIERIENDLDGSFDISIEPNLFDFVIKRKLKYCPHCRGKGEIKIYERPILTNEILNETISEQQDIYHKIIKCSHKPKRNLNG